MDENARIEELEADALSDLAALPHLERLECYIQPTNIALLGSLRQLRALRLTLDSYEHKWTDAEIRALGELRLPHLESLALESRISCVYRECRDGRDDGVLVSAPFSPLTTDGGLRHLLLLPSLTHLKLPWWRRML